jgi:hypothetical protein
MPTTSKFNLSTLEPNFELLRNQGWSVIAAHGPYCTAWKGSSEIVLVWRDGEWYRLSGGIQFST